MRLLSWRGLFLAIWFASIALRHYDRNPQASIAMLAAAALGVVIVAVHQRRRRPDLGIKFVGALRTSAFPVAAGARCLVCRSGLDGEIIYCASCHTPHHRECLRWVGACSVYACRGREFRKAG